jgi:hypothetical protein
MRAGKKPQRAWAKFGVERQRSEPQRMLDNVLAALRIRLGRRVETDELAEYANVLALLDEYAMYAMATTSKPFTLKKIIETR